MTPRARRLARGARDSLEAATRFALTPASPRPLAFFRIGLCALALVKLAILGPYMQQLYGNYGLVQWAILETSPGLWVPSIGKLCVFLQRYGISSATCLNGVFAIFALALLGLGLGWKTRVFAVIAWLAHTLTVNSGYMSLYGIDTMIQLSLFYFVWMPVGAAVSLDAWRRGKPVVPTAAAGLALRTLQLHMCIIYFDAGLGKLRGAQWRNGEAMWRALTSADFAIFDFSWLARVPSVAVFLCWATMVIEIGYPLFIWSRRTRPWWIVLTVVLHLGIAATLGLWMFSLMMILMTVSVFGVPLFMEPGARAPSASSAGASSEPVVRPSGASL
jgi:hypothetical protein